ANTRWPARVQFLSSWRLEMSQSKHNRGQMILAAVAAASVSALMGFGSGVHADTINKANNTTALNLAGSWTGGIVPDSDDVAAWQAGFNSNSAVLGADTSWQGILVTNPSRGPLIPVGNTLTLGSFGIDMSAA